MKYPLLCAALGLAAIVPAYADDGKIAFHSNRTGNYDIFVMNPDGQNVIDITNTPNIGEAWPSWNSAGTRIAFERPSDIWTMAADGTDRKRIPVGGLPQFAAFRPNSQTMSYSINGGADADIFLVQQDGTGRHRILNNRLGDYYCRWRPDGSKIVFYTFEEDSGVPYIATANSDGSGQVRITTSDTDRNPSWSPDGGRIVFQSYRSGKEQIYVMNPDGSGQTRLTSNKFNDTSPVFSPDGSKIAFVSDRDGNKEIYVMNANGTGQTRLTNDPAEDDAPSWQQALPANPSKASISDSVVNEGAGQADFTVSLSAISASTVTIQYTTYADTAGTDDFTPVPAGVVTIPPGQISTVIHVPIVEDSLPESDEIFRVRIAPQGATAADSAGVCTIKDDDGAPVLNVQPVTMAEGNSGASPSTFNFTLSEASGSEVSFAYTCLDESAKTGNDYMPKNGTLVIPAGQTTAVLKIPVVGDTILESDESFVVRLGSPVNCSLAKNQVRCTITNDDTTPYVSIGNAGGSEGSVLTFWVSVSHLAATDVSVKYATQDGTAVAGQDYTARQGTVTIPAGSTSKKIEIQTLDDDTPESDETFRIILSDATGGVLTGAQAVGTITSDDLPEIIISDVQMREGKAGQRDMVFTLSLSEPVPFVVSVNCATSDGSAVAGTDYVAKEGIVSFAPNQTSRTFAVPIVGDTAFESTEEFYVNLDGANGGTIATPLGTGTIVNDDVKAAASGTGS